jgi:hypothetical protein
MSRLVNAPYISAWARSRSREPARVDDVTSSTNSNSTIKQLYSNAACEQHGPRTVNPNRKTTPLLQLSGWSVSVRQLKLVELGNVEDEVVES